MTPDELIQSARVPRPFVAWQEGGLNARLVRIPGQERGDIVQLSHHCMAGLHMIDDKGFGGYIVMEDSPQELRRHLPILLCGRGRILKTGLGLGCVVRGLLAKEEVEHIDVIEISDVIIRRVGTEFAGNPRVTIHHGDALKLEVPGRWDFAWHDIYCEGNDGLELLHAKLIKRFSTRCKKQGAWAFPRFARRLMPGLLYGRPAGWGEGGKDE